MKSYKLIGLMLLILVCLIPASLAFETTIPIIKEVNISFDPGQGFEIENLGIDEDHEKAFTWVFSINGTEGNAQLYIQSFFIFFEEADPLEFANLVSDMSIGRFKLEGYKEIGNDSVNSSLGQNIRIRTIYFPKSNNQSSFAYWPLDKYNYGIVESDDINLSKKLVETLEIKP
jgi:hypothetical protein